MKTIKEVAENIMFGHISIKDILVNFEYKKNKQAEDIQKAIRTGLKKGEYKTEIELEQIELELGKVLKIKKEVK